MARVMVVDDEPNIVLVLRVALEEMGHEVQTAADGREALELLGSGSRLPDILLLDLLMPVVSGREVLAHMRSDPRLAQVPVIVFTGSVAGPGNFPPPEHYQELVNKPFDLFYLLRLISERAASSDN